MVCGGRHTEKSLGIAKFLLSRPKESSRQGKSQAGRGVQGMNCLMALILKLTHYNLDRFTLPYTMCTSLLAFLLLHGATGTLLSCRRFRRRAFLFAHWPACD